MLSFSCLCATCSELSVSSKMASTLQLDDGKSQQSSQPKFHVWDSQYGLSNEAFSFFRETVRGTFMPWTSEAIRNDFEGRVESLSLENGVISRVRMNQSITTKAKSNIFNSVDEFIHGNFVLSGELEVVQGGRANVAKPGDLVLYHRFSPVTLTGKPEKPDGLFDDLAFSIPRSQFSANQNAEDIFCNSLLTKGKMINPLESCLELIAKKLHLWSADELSALFNACIALLPLSAGRWRRFKEAGNSKEQSYGARHYKFYR